MKKLLVILFLAPALSWAQSRSIDAFIKQYQDKEDVSVVSIEGTLFNLIASIADEESSDEEMQAIKRVFANIENLKIVSVPYRSAEFNKEKFSEFRSDLRKDKYEELMTMRDDDKNMTFMSQGDNSELSNIVVLIDEGNKLTVLSVIGTVDVRDLAYLARNHDDYH
jgi:hypothetical protein